MQTGATRDTDGISNLLSRLQSKCFSKTSISMSVCCRLLQGSCQAVCGNSFHSLEIPCLYPWEQRSYAPWRIHQPPDSGENIHWFKPAACQHFCLYLSSTSALISHYLHYSHSIYIVSTSNILISIEYFHHFVF